MRLMNDGGGFSGHNLSLTGVSLTSRYKVRECYVCYLPTKGLRREMLGRNKEWSIKFPFFEINKRN